MKQPELDLDLYSRAWFDGYDAALEQSTPFAALCVYGVTSGITGLLVGFFLARWIYA